MPSFDVRKVAEVMLRDLVTASRGATLDQAEGLMRFGRLRHLLVVEGQTVLGLVSHHAVLEASLATLREKLPGGGADLLSAVTIEGLVRGEPLTIAPESSLEAAASRMLALRLGCLPVTTPSARGPRLEGLITEAALLRAAYLPGLPRG
jgi:acetoin utilization protein AcuB